MLPLLLDPTAQLSSDESVFFCALIRPMLFMLYSKPAASLGGEFLYLLALNSLLVAEEVLGTWEYKDNLLLSES